MIEPKISTIYTMCAPLNGVILIPVLKWDISKSLKKTPTEAFAFDARIIILPKDKLQDYFHSRQAFAMAAFMDRLCSFYQLSVEKRTVAYVKTALKEKGMDWNKFPQYVCSGYVAFGKEKWEVETASDFAQKWDKYNESN